MSKLFTFLILGLVCYLLYKKVNSGNASPRSRQARQRSNDPERIIACAHCGVHLPESEGVHAGGRFFCSDEHRRLGA